MCCVYEGEMGGLRLHHPSGHRVLNERCRRLHKRALADEEGIDEAESMQSFPFELDTIARDLCG